VNGRETFVLMGFVVLIVAWALLGPGGLVSGLIGAIVGIALGGGLIAARRRRPPEGG